MIIKKSSVVSNQSKELYKVTTSSCIYYVSSCESVVIVCKVTMAKSGGAVINR